MLLRAYLLTVLAAGVYYAAGRAVLLNGLGVTPIWTVAPMIAFAVAWPWLLSRVVPEVRQRKLGVAALVWVAMGVGVLCGAMAMVLPVLWQHYPAPLTVELRNAMWAASTVWLVVLFVVLPVYVVGWQLMKGFAGR